MIVEATVPTRNTNVSLPDFRGYHPRPLAFGTSGLRGLVADITDLEAYINTRGFLDYLFEIKDVRKGEIIYVAGDLRPSTDSPARSIMAAVARAIAEAGLKVVSLGKIPTPALVSFAIEHDQPSIMVTGSHIPFDRNGIKFNKSQGEVLKKDEKGILDAVDHIRRQEYSKSSSDSLFKDDGMFKEGQRPVLPPVDEQGRKAYADRYLNFFAPGALKGKNVVFYQHSAVGRDLLVDILEQLGATVFPAGRSESFIPIDTEAITGDRIKDLQKLADEASDKHGVIHAIVSTDGDSDRPLLAGIDPKGKVHFLGGDLLGMLIAEFLGAKSVAVPISTNDAVDLKFIPNGVYPVKTKIGSPYVIKAMQDLLSEANAGPVVGWEANGGFLVGSDITRKGKMLKALPTRDAALPLIAALAFAGEKEITLLDLFSQLPHRFSQAALIDNFPQDDGRALIRRFSPENPEIIEIEFKETDVFITKGDGQGEKAIPALAEAFRRVQTELESFFTEELGFDSLIKINTIDGVRVYFKNGDIAHIRPSGNAPQLRIYAVANSQERADSIAQWGTSEPDGLLKSLQRLVQK